MHISDVMHSKRDTQLQGLEERGKTPKVYIYISVNQLISTAVAEKISALMTETDLIERAATGSHKDFEDIMSRVPDIPPDPMNEC